MVYELHKHIMKQPVHTMIYAINYSSYKNFIMKKLLLLSLLFLAFACSKLDEDNEEEPSLYDYAFINHVDGLGFVNSDGDSEKYLFFYDSDIFLKEVYVYSDGFTDCLTMKEGSNISDSYNFTAKLFGGVKGGGNGYFGPWLVEITYDNIRTIYGYKINWKNTAYVFPYSENEVESLSVSSQTEGEEQGPSEVYIRTSITHASLCN